MYIIIFCIIIIIIVISISQGFSIENVSRILISKFTDLFQLAYSLFGNSVKLRRLFTDHGISTKGEVIDYWMRHGNQPSWEKVAVAIENCLPEHFELANSLRKECLPDVQSKHPSIQKMCKQNLLYSGNN